ncbi:transglutaminase-like domain-containing protein [Sphingobacterium rhinopitheci]|uniref:transglutaminase-like domain-containing protein n=1 Tax=Sphingobacterium rhinopitheci TaxID=2781960 RepID=UPI001F518D68|nr:transglutaminase-like domain-containing protein [Sphingobacterium rhinopitheci]MCI0921711.1 transglutaminase family protein [Sphingobacterium rhinopitheci]
MKSNEFKALVSLLDDPDNAIFHHVKQQLISYGPESIPYLEEYWETSFDPLSQNRVENIIHKIQFDQIQNEIQLWALQNQEDLLEGLLIVNRYQYPNLDENKIQLQIAELRRNVWFELIYEMRPIEKIKLLNNIIFREFGLSGNTTNYHDPNNSYISSVLETKKGNPISLACIYSIVAQKLDIPIYGINLPKHFIVAYMDELNLQPLFYLNTFNKGQIMKHEDIYSFLQQLNLPKKEEYLLPCSNIEIIKRVLRNLMTAYDNLDNRNKKEEINILLKLLDGTN